MITYAVTQRPWEGYTRRFLEGVLDQHPIGSVCEVGAGANPLFEEEYVRQNGLDYTLLDISAKELDKAPDGYRKIVADIAAADFDHGQRFDLVFSKMLAEHIRNAQRFHRNVMSLLAPGGLAVHFFPTLYTLPFLVNVLVPESLGSLLLNLFAPRDRYQEEKFPAYYRWCRGPTRRQIGRFKGLGYNVVEYRGFFGHSAYYDRMAPLKKIHESVSNFLLKHPRPLLTSYACVVLQRPLSDGL